MAEEVSDAPPPSFSLAGTRPAFLTPEDAQFDACLATSFGGFVKEAASELPKLAKLRTASVDPSRPNDVSDSDEENAA